MATHRCAVCGSANVVTDTQAAGLSYNTTKGAIGNAVLGAVQHPKRYYRYYKFIKNKYKHISMT